MRVKPLVVAALAGLACVAPAVPASAAAAQCSIVAPTKVVIDQPYRGVPLRLSSNCAAAGAVYASWDFVHPREGFSDIAIFDGTTTDTWDLYDWEAPGAYAIRPSAAFRADFSDVTQNTATTTVKLGSRLTATTTRANGQLRFSARATTWSPRTSGWYQRAGAKVSLMYLAPGSSTWTWVKAATTSGSGRVTLSVAPKYGQYRLMVKETATVWAGYSSVVRGK